ncbi:MAG: tRNA1(Val) (adenine(37)-N6)-methyltransferase [Desulfobacteraceae bacterium]|nr:tRNA1(Val) (adenine(37)-N6)-methyltransferase [Desulfobacteraceae bacterium]
MTELTEDSFFQGELRVSQARDGYRFSIDAILLAATIETRPGEAVLDIGTGCGIIPLLLAFRHPDISIHALEIQPELAKLAQKNVSDNKMAARITITCADVRRLSDRTFEHPFDWVVSNPPYHRPFSGRLNPNHQRALARHEIMLDLDELLLCARRMLRTGGRLAMIYPADRLSDLVAGMRQAGIEPKWLRTIHSQEGEEARLALIKGVKAGKPGLRIAPPLIVYEPDGRYVEEVRKMMQP